MINFFVVGVTVLTTLFAWYKPAWKGVLVGYPYRTYGYGEWYRCLTQGFVHADIAHLLFNMYTLYSFGSLVEEIYSYIWGAKGGMLYVLLYFELLLCSFWSQRRL